MHNKAIIKYKGKDVFIGLSKGPLIENKSGHGFLGVKLQKKDRSKILCNECGKWLKCINNSHLKQHGLTVMEYKNKYGYFKSTALHSDQDSNLRASRMTDNVIKREMAIKRLEKARSVVNHEKRLKKSREARRKLEYQNLKGTCFKQLKEATVNFIERFQRMPSSSAGRDGFQHCKTLRRRFGSMNKAFKAFGLPTRHQQGSFTKYVFPDQTIFWIMHGKGYPELCNLIKEKC